jgi:hypothetical protein
MTLRWIKASFSFSNGNCVEVALLPDGGAMVRDSKNRPAVLSFTPAEWDAFLQGAKAGEFDHIGAPG